MKYSVQLFPTLATPIAGWMAARTTSPATGIGDCGCGSVGIRRASLLGGSLLPRRGLQDRASVGKTQSQRAVVESVALCVSAGEFRRRTRLRPRGIRCSPLDGVLNGNLT